MKKQIKTRKVRQTGKTTKSSALFLTSHVFIERKRVCSGPKVLEKTKTPTKTLPAEGVPGPNPYVFGYAPQQLNRNQIVLGF